ncbi:hypothetical protein ACE193_01385 [Bernardetia sp. OM2101]|uniref:hypothetical protein n=1 Tax=Bernardetia sp. OM2101 TaxID=3344876 RepID=UPI0035D0B78C
MSNFKIGDNVKLKSGGLDIYYVKSINVLENTVMCACYNPITKKEEEHTISKFLLKKVSNNPPSFTKTTINI